MTKDQINLKRIQVLLLPSWVAARCSATSGIPPTKASNDFNKLHFFQILKHCLSPKMTCSLIKIPGCFAWGPPVAEQLTAAAPLGNNNTTILYKLSDLSSSAIKMLELAFAV